MKDIVISGLYKAFGDKKVLENYSRVFEAGTMSRLEGASGSGKTTLLRIIAGLETPDAGEISGVPERVSFVFQEDRLCEDFSALANVMLSGAGRADAEALLTELGLGNDFNTKAKDLSGGMRRRVALARALLFPADLYIFDEPYTGLDADNRKLCEKAIERITAGKSSILVSHES